MSFTKSQFLTFLDCPRHFWVLLKYPETKPKFTEHQQFLAKQGYKIEKYAHEYFEQYLKDNNKKIGTINFQAKANARNLYAKADLMHYNEETAKWDIYEVKSGSNAKKKYVFDIGFQRFVFRKAGYKIGDLYIIHPNSNYTRGKDLELEKFFTITNVTNRVDEYEKEIRKSIRKMKWIARFRRMEKVPACTKPKTCNFLDYCHPDLPEYSIFDINRITDKKKLDLLTKGIIRIQDIPDDYPLSKKQKHQVQITKSGNEYIDQNKLREEFAKLEYPLYYLDYESLSSAIPQFAKFRPYDHIVFQYSLHIQNEPNGKVIHKEFIHDKFEDPNSHFLKAMQNDIGDKGSVIVWHRSFEEIRNKEMAKRNSDFKEFLENVNSRIFDLEEIFKQGMYMHPDIKGRSSIKAVLPIIAPGLNYTELEISEGATASIEWFKMTYKDRAIEEKKGKIMQNLLDYCELDTLAMVKILNFLQNKIK